MRLTWCFSTVGLGVVLSSCGAFENQNSAHGSSRSGSGDGTLADSGDQKPWTYAKVSDRPVCDAKREGELILIMENKTFQLCRDGAWQDVDLKGDKGDAGTAGQNGADGKDGTSDSLTRALKLYQEQRRAVMRITVTCGAAGGGGNPSSQWGSGFRCSDTQVCTNAHVVTCAAGSVIRNLKIEAISEQLDSTGNDRKEPSDGNALPGFFQSINPEIKKSPNRDLAKITAANFPAGTPVTSLPKKPWKERLQVFDEILSLSFPLAFQDLYVDLGRVNVEVITECQGTGAGSSKYGCPKQAYDFATTNNTDHGSSGSPLFHLPSGEVIGVTSAGTDGENANFTWAIDAYELTSF